MLLCINELMSDTKQRVYKQRPHFEREKASLVWACGAFEWCNQNSI